MTIYLSWGYGWDSTALGILIANKDPRLEKYWGCEIIATDPGCEQDRTYTSTIPFYRKYFEDRGLKVTILTKGYNIYDYFYEKQQVMMGIFNPKCSSHFKRDLINSYYSKTHGRNGRIYKDMNISI